MLCFAQEVMTVTHSNAVPSVLAVCYGMVRDTVEAQESRFDKHIAGSELFMHGICLWGRALLLLLLILNRARVWFLYLSKSLALYLVCVCVCVFFSLSSSSIWKYFSKQWTTWNLLFIRHSNCSSGDNSRRGQHRKKKFESNQEKSDALKRFAKTKKTICFYDAESVIISACFSFMHATFNGHGYY